MPFTLVGTIMAADHGRVEALGIATTRASPIVACDTLDIVTTRGVVGDRYADNAGTFDGHPDQEVTLIEAEDAEDNGVAPLDARRNIVTRGADLQALVGRTFRLGTAVLHGMRPCLPCGHLGRMLEKPDLHKTLRGGLRARVVRPGRVRIGDAIEPVPVCLDDDMRAVIASAHLAFVATVTADGHPNLSPKGTIRVLDETRLFFLELASPQTRKNLATNPWMELNVVDTTSRRGYRFFGRAETHADDAVHAAAAAQIAREEGVAYRDRGAIVLTLERALPLVSPGYQHVADEQAMRAAWVDRRRELDIAFEHHAAAHPWRDSA